MTFDLNWIFQPASKVFSPIGISRINLAIWLCGTALEFGILVRGWQNKALKKYLFYYMFIGNLVVLDFVLYGVQQYCSGPQFDLWAWRAGVAGHCLCLMIIWEGIRHTLSDERFGSGFVKRVRQCFVGSAAILVPLWIFTPTPSSFDREALLLRNIAYIEGALFFLVIGTIWNYEVPVGKNLQGFLTGYGFALSANIVILTLRCAIGMPFDRAWVVGQPLANVIGLAMACVGMWNIHPTPAYSPRVVIETRADILVRRAKYKLATVRGYCARLVRS